jgi:hypothetical protein
VLCACEEEEALTAGTERPEIPFLSRLGPSASLSVTSRLGMSTRRQRTQHLYGCSRLRAADDRRIFLLLVWLCFDVTVRYTSQRDAGADAGEEDRCTFTETGTFCAVDSRRYPGLTTLCVSAILPATSAPVFQQNSSSCGASCFTICFRFGRYSRTLVAHSHLTDAPMQRRI